MNQQSKILSEKLTNKIKKLPDNYHDLFEFENPYAIKLNSYVAENFPSYSFNAKQNYINELFSNRFIAHTLLSDFESIDDIKDFIKFYASFVLLKYDIDEIEFYEKTIGAINFHSQNTNQTNLMREKKLHLPLYRINSRFDIELIFAMMRNIEFQIVYQKNFICGNGLNKKITKPCKVPNRYEMDYAHERMQDFFEFLEVVIGRPEITVKNKKLNCPNLNQLNFLLKENALSEQLAYNNSVSEMNVFFKFIKYVYSKEFKNANDEIVKKRAKIALQVLQKEIEQINENQNRYLKLRQNEVQNSEKMDNFRKFDAEIKKRYHEYCEGCLNDEFMMVNESLQWELITQGMKVCRYYNQDLADKLYEKCYKNGEYKSCLNILNAPSYPSSQRQIETLIAEFSDNPNFEKDFYEFLINYEKHFLQNSYESTIKNQERDLVVNDYKRYINTFPNSEEYTL